MEVEGRKVYSVRAFNQGVAGYIEKLPTVWVEGEVTELRRQERWASVFFTLKDPDGGACLAVQMPRGQFDGLRLDLADGERVHVFGRPELYEQRGDFHLRALTIERYGIGAHLAALGRGRAGRARPRGARGPARASSRRARARGAPRLRAARRAAGGRARAPAPGAGTRARTAALAPRKRPGPPARTLAAGDPR